MFDELADWEVFVRRDGQVYLAGVFRQSYPEDAVALLMTVARAKSLVSDGWRFVCVTRTAEHVSRTLFFETSPTGKPLRLADSFLGVFEQYSPDATA